MFVVIYLVQFLKVLDNVIVKRSVPITSYSVLLQLHKNNSNKVYTVKQEILNLGEKVLGVTAPAVNMCFAVLILCIRVLRCKRN